MWFHAGHHVPHPTTTCAVRVQNPFVLAASYQGLVITGAVLLQTFLRDLSEKAFKKRVYGVLEVASNELIKSYNQIKNTKRPLKAPKRYVCTVSPDDKYRRREFDEIPVRACHYSSDGRIKELAAISTQNPNVGQEAGSGATDDMSDDGGGDSNAEYVAAHAHVIR